MPRSLQLRLTSSLLIAVFAVVVVQCTPAQTYTVLHNFNDADGWFPESGLTMDRAGNLYGTTGFGGYYDGPICFSGGCGTVYRVAYRNSGWVFDPIYRFTGPPDGKYPGSRVVFGPDGALYGTTTRGGANACGAHGCGTVFRLTPSATACLAARCLWTETILHSFAGPDGAIPGTGDLIFDDAGNLYGTTTAGGSFDQGTVYELSPSANGWTETVLYDFVGNGDSAGGNAGVIFDHAGNLYGTAGGGLYGDGTVYQLRHSASGWTETILHNFNFYDGTSPVGGLIFDANGNLYGGTYAGGTSQAGTIYELTPGEGGWQFNVLYNFAGNEGTAAALAMDQVGNLYGTLSFTLPEVFRLTPSGGQWMLTGFNGSAGSMPLGNVVFDSNGNLYTTASAGGTHGVGVVFKVTP